jgi:predicted transcriptional regulator YheO
MRIRISLKSSRYEKLIERLRQAYANGQLRLVKRIHALLYIVDGKTVEEVVAILDLSEQSVYNYVTAFILKGWEVWCTNVPLVVPQS